MHINLSSLLAISILIPAVSAVAQKPGDSVTTEALGKAEWIQGAAPTEWEPGKVYILECWATWCGPCVVAIPHVDALYDKYKDKGLRVLGMDVFEDGKDGPAAFVKKKGDGMSYPVAYVGKDGAFEKEWLIPAGVDSIPAAFIVKDGKVLQLVHPSEISDAMVEKLLAGGSEHANISEGDEQGGPQQGNSQKLLQAYAHASSKSDIPAMEAAIAALRENTPESPMLVVIELDAASKKSDWKAVESNLENLRNFPQFGFMLGTVADQLARSPDSPLELRKYVAKELESGIAKEPSYLLYFGLAELQWSFGEKETAKLTAKRAVEWAKSPGAEDGTTSGLDLLEKLSQSLEEGILPALK